MKTHLTIILIGLVSGFIGILPLFRKKADRYSLLAAFLLFFMMPYVVYHFHLPWAAWWWKGMVIPERWLCLWSSLHGGAVRVVHCRYWCPPWWWVRLSLYWGTSLFDMHIHLRKGDVETFKGEGFIDFLVHVEEDVPIVRCGNPSAHYHIDGTVA